MAFQLKAGQSLSAGIRRIAREQIEKALKELTGRAEGDREEIVHTARKRFKRLRGLLRLVRDDLGAKAYRRENSCFRDAGQPLTQVRDAAVLLQAFDDLTNLFADLIPPHKFRKLREGLQAHRDRVQHQVFQEHDTFAEVAVRIEAARLRLKEWPLTNRWSTLRNGLKRSYRSGREAFRAVSADPTTEKLHEWRKQAKYLGYQLQCLEAIYPKRLSFLVELTQELSDHLGDDHDLAVLRQMIESDGSAFGGRAVVDPFLSLIDRRRAELQQEARLVGQALYHDRPKRFVDRLTDYWKAWRKHKKVRALSS